MAALPAAVTADERDRWVDAILFDTPLPNDFETASLGNPDAVMMPDGFQGLPGRAAIAVAYAWTDQWFDADEAGDADARSQAADALADIRDWAVFSNTEPSVVEDFAGLADSLVAGATVNGQHVDREMVDMAFSCTTGQIPNG